MGKILAKRFPRELKKNWARYLMLIFLIILGMYIIISIVGSAYNIIQGTADKRIENKIEDGRFSTLYPLSDEELKEIEQQGITVEAIFSTDIKGTLKHDRSKASETSEKADKEVDLRIMKLRKEIDLLDIDEGVVPSEKTDNTYDIVVDNLFAKKNSLNIGNTIIIADKKYKISAVGSVPDYDLPLKATSDMTQDSENFGCCFVTENIYNDILESEEGMAEEYAYAYRLNGKMSNTEFKDFLDRFLIKTEDIEDLKVRLFVLFSGMENESRIISFMESADNPRIASSAASDVEIKQSMGMVAGVIIMILFTYVISVFVSHQIQQETSVIGALYALGVKKKSLMLHYLCLPTVAALIGGIIGTILGFSPIGVSYQMLDSYDYYSIPEMPLRYPAFLIIYGIVMPPLVSALVNFLVVRKRLSATPLSLIKNEQKRGKSKGISIKRLGFIRTFQLRQMIREKKATFTVVFGMFISMIIFLIGFDCYVLCRHVEEQNIADTKYEYMYLLKYPEEETPKGAEECYVEALSREYMEYRLDTNIIGIDSDNKYFDAHPVSGTDKVEISTSFSQKYGVEKGDKITLSDHSSGKDYTFTVTGIADYSVGLAVFMDIDSMRELFEKDKDYYNMLLSDESLDITSEKIYSITTKSQVEHAAGIFSIQMSSLVFIMCGVSFIIFCAVMFLMMNVMIERSSFGISLVKIFGYRGKEVRKLYLNGNIFVVALGAAISIIAAKFIADSLYPAFIANTAMGMDLSFEWYYYIGIFVGVMVIYKLIESVLMLKMKKILPAEVLKNRE